MRAAAKISVLPVLLKSGSGGELDRVDEEHATPADEQSREG